MKKQKNSVRKLLTLVCSGVLLVCLTVGVTVAYLSSTSTVTNTFTVGKVQITLDEGEVYGPTEAEPGKFPGKFKDGGVTRVQENTYKLFPAGEYDKDPTVHVAEDSEDAYLGVQVVFEDGAGADDLGIDMLACFEGFAMADWALSPKVVGSDDVTYTLTYKTMVEGGDNIVLFNKLNVPEELTNDQLAKLNNVKMKITAYAVQADGFTTPKGALDSGFSTISWPSTD